MRDTTNRLRTQLDRLVKRQPVLAGASLWDCICGAVPMPPMHMLDPRHLEMVEALSQAANLPSPTPDRYELKLEAFLDVPDGLPELSPDIITGDQN